MYICLFMHVLFILFIDVREYFFNYLLNISCIIKLYNIIRITLYNGIKNIVHNQSILSNI